MCLFEKFKKINEWKDSHLIVLLCLIILNVFAYAPHFSSELALDDQAFVHRAYHQEFPELKDYFIKADKQHYTPLGLLIYNILFTTFSQNITLLRSIILLVHTLSCYLIFCLLTSLGLNSRIAFLACALFAIHPFNVINVYHLCHVLISLMGIFMCLSLLTFIHCQSTSGKKKYGYWIASLLFYGFALLCQEFALVTPLYILLICHFVRKIPLKETLKTCLPYVIVSIIFLSTWLMIAGIHGGTINATFLTPPTLAQYLVNFLDLCTWYLTEFFYPAHVVVIHNISTPINLLLIGFAISLIFLIPYLLRKKLPLFWLLWFLVGLIPPTLTTFVHNQMGMVLEPHWLYFPSIGLFTYISFLILRLSDHFRPPLRLPICIMVVAYYFSFSPLYGFYWQNNLNYGHFWLKNNPTNTIAMQMLGDAYLAKKDVANARKYYELMLEKTHFPRSEIFSNLATVYLELKDLKTARNYSKKSLEIQPHDANAYNLLGVIDVLEGNIPTGQKEFLEAIRWDPHLTEAKLYLAQTFLVTKDYPRAIEAYTKILQEDPQNPQATDIQAKLAFLYIATKNPDQYYRITEQMTRENPENIHILIATFEEMGLKDFAEEIRKNYAQLKKSKK